MHSVPGLSEVGVDLGQELVGLRSFGHREAGRGVQLPALDPGLGPRGRLLSSEESEE